MLKRIGNDSGSKPDPTWRRYPSSAESSCERCAGQGYLLRAYPNHDSSVPNYRAVPCPACSALKT